MPIDPRIPLQAKAPQPRSILDSYARLSGMRNATLYGQEAKLRIQKLEEEEKDREREKRGQKLQNNLMQKHIAIGTEGKVTTNHKAIQAGLIRGGFPELATKYEGAIAQTRGALIKESKEKIEFGLQKTKALAQLISHCVKAPEDQKPDCYRHGMKEAKAMGIATEWPDEYTSDMGPDLVSLGNMALTTQEGMTNELARKEKEAAKAEKATAEGKVQAAKVMKDMRERFRIKELAKVAEANPALYNDWSAADQAAVAPLLSPGFKPPVSDPEARKDQKRIVNNIVDSIIRGDTPPINTTGARLTDQTMAVMSGLSDKGYNLSKRRTDWLGTVKHIQSMNSTTQVRLKQAIGTLSHSIGLLKEKFKAWHATGILPSGFRTWNSAAIAIAKRSPGKMGVAAQALDTQINDMTAEIAQVFMGGNSPTDHALKLAGENLKSNWNKETAKELITQLESNLQFRLTAMLEAQPAGVSVDNPYYEGDRGGGDTDYKYIAVNPQTGEKQGSNDGVTWEPIQ